MDDLRERVVAILSNVLLEDAFLESQDFFEDGIVDSFDMIEISVQLEKDLSLPEDAIPITHKNFANVDTICAAVLRSRGQEAWR